MKKSTYLWSLFLRFLPLIVILILMGVIYATGLVEYLSFEQLKKHHRTLKMFVQDHPLMTPFLYILTYAIAVALSLPGGIFLSLAGGLLFEQPFSILYAVTGATIGAICIFLTAKTALGDVLKRKAGPFLQKMEAGLQENAASYLLFLRFVPIFPFWLVNIAPAFFGVPLWTFIWTTFIGIIPGAFVYTQAGQGLSSIFTSGEEFSLDAIFNMQIRIALMALGIFALIPIIVKKIRKSSTSADQ